MKKATKPLCLLLSVIVLAACIPMTTIAATAAETYTCILSVNTVSGKPGDTVETVISAQANHNVAAGDIVLYYDASVLEVESVYDSIGTVQTGIISGGALAENPQQGMIRLAFASCQGWPESGDNTGQLCYIRFKIREAAPSSVSSVTIDQEESMITTITGEGKNLRPVPCALSFVDGSVKITNGVDEVVSLINALDGEITLESEDAIVKAREAYDALPDDQKALVDEEVLAKLTSAEAALAVLKDQAAADAVAQQIAAALPDEGTLTTDELLNLRAAFMAYDALTQEQKALIDEQLIAELEAAIDKLNLVYGDIDLDGDVDAGDALRTLQYSVRLIELTGEQFLCADVDGNNKVNSTDALYMLMYSVALIDQFPAQIEFPVQN